MQNSHGVQCFEFECWKIECAVFILIWLDLDQQRKQL